MFRPFLLPLRSSEIRGIPVFVLVLVASFLSVLVSPSAYAATAIGNLIFIDLDNDGRYEPVDFDYGVDDVSVELFLQGQDPNVDVPAQTTTTANGGLYQFDNLSAASYFVHVPKENFESGGALEYYGSSSGGGVDNATDDDTDEDGIDTPSPAFMGVSSAVHILTETLEPTGESGKSGYTGALADNSVDLTADFGFASPLTERKVVFGFETDDAGSPMTPGVTDLRVVQPYANLFAPGVGVQFAASDPTNNPLNLYNSEGTGGLDDDLERNSTGSGLWQGGNLTNDVVANILILQEDNVSYATPNDNGAGGNFILTSDLPLTSFAFDFIDLDAGRVATSSLIIENTSNPSASPVVIPWGDLEGTSPSVYSTSGAVFGNRHGNRVLEITTEKLGLSSFNKVTLVTSGSGGIGSVCLIPSASVALGNRVWVDSVNANGVYDSGEGLAGVTVELYQSAQQPGVDTPEATTVTDANGHYLFDYLTEGNYVTFIPAQEFASGELAGSSPLSGSGVDDGRDEDVDENGLDVFVNGGIASGVVSLLAGTEPVAESSQSSYTGILPDGSVDMTIDFGFAASNGQVALGSVVWVDDAVVNGSFDAGEGKDGVVVQLFQENKTPGIDMPFRSTSTSGGGIYFFDQLPEGSYVVHIPVTEGANGPLAGSSSLSGAGGDDGIDHDDNGLDTAANGGVSSSVITLAAGTEPVSDDDTGYAGGLADNAVDATIDFGFNASTGTAAIGSRVWLDDGDGIFQSSEGANGVEVALYFDPTNDGDISDGVFVLSTVTSSDGFYLFDQLPALNFVVHIPKSEFASGPLAGANSLTGADSGELDEGVATNENGVDAVLSAGISSGVINLTANGQPTGESSQSDYPGSLDDDDVDMTIDFAFVPQAPGPAVGNVVFIDADSDGVFDVGEGINGVTVQLYSAMQSLGVDAPIRETTSTVDGNYLFDLLTDGEYRVYIPASEFGPGEPLQDYESLPGAGGDDTNDDDADENGLDTAINGGIASSIIIVTEGGEPTNESGSSTGPTSVVGDDSANLTVDFGFWKAPPTGAIGNVVWVDENSDGYQDPGEPGLANIQIILRDSTGTQLSTATTDAHGGYLFNELSAGDYFVDVNESSLPSGLTQTPPSTNTNADFGNQDHSAANGYPVTIGGSEPLENHTGDFGYNWNPAADVNSPSGSESGAIGDYVWYDSNGNGVKDPHEVGIAGVAVDLHGPGPDLLFNTGDDTTATVNTDANGRYIFDGLPVGAYCVKIPSSNFATNGPLEGFGQTGDPDHFGQPWPGGVPDDHETTVPIILGPGDVFLNADFGYNHPSPTGIVGSIGDTIWLDLDADGTGASINPIDSGTPETQGDSTGAADVNEASQGIPGVTVALVKDSDEDGVLDSGEPYIATTATNEDGQYLFTGLALDDGGGDGDADYLVVITDTHHVLSGLSATWDSDGTLASPNKSAVAISAGSPDSRTQDFGYTTGDPLGRIGNYVWLDSDGLGDQDESHAGIPGVIVELLSATGGVVKSVTTDRSGHYTFDLLPLDSYQVRVAASNFTSGQPLYKHTNTGDPNGGGDSIGAIVALTVAAPFNEAQDLGYNTDGTIATGDTVGSIGDTVWFDTDGSGGDQTTQGSDSGLPCVLVNLYQDDGDGNFEPEADDYLVAQQYTDGQGNYLFTSLTLDTRYFVQVETDSLPGYIDPAPTHEEVASGESTLGNSVSDAVPSAATPHVRDQDFSYAKLVAATDIGSIGDYVWFDVDSSGGNQAASPGERGLPGVTIVLQNNTSTEIARRTTDAKGFYLFDGLSLDDGADADNDADYTVVVDVSTLPRTVSRSASYSNATVSLSPSSPHDRNEDFSFPPQSILGAIGDYVWLDADGADTQNESGAGLDGVLVELLDHNGNVIASTETNENGYYSFTSLHLDDGADGDSDADYQVRIANENFASDGALQGMSHTGSAINSADGDTLLTVSLTTGGPINLAQDFGYRGTIQGTIGNLLWLDSSADGVWNGVDGADSTPSTDDDEPLIAGVTVELYRDLNGNGLLDPGEQRLGVTSTDGFVTSTSGDSGNYLFTGLPVADMGNGSSGSDYIVHVTDTAGVLAGHWHSLGTLATTDHSQVDPYGTVSITSGSSENLTADFGYFRELACIGNRAFVDADDNGDQGSAESGLNGVTVSLLVTYPSTANITARTLTANEPGTTDAGYYKFGVLADEDYAVGSGSATVAQANQPAYQLSANLPSGYVLGKVDLGSNDQLDGDAHNGVAALPTQGLTDVSMIPGAANTESTVIASYDFAYLVETKSMGWNSFVTVFGLTGDDALPQPTGLKPDAGNPDKDIYDNVLEYAFCLHPEEGLPAYSPFCVELNKGSLPTDPSDDTMEAAFRRPLGGLTDVTYCLEARSSLPTSGDLVWTQIAEIPGQGGGASGATITDMVDGTEEVRLANIDSTPPLALSIGFIRLVVKLDNEGGVGIDYTSHTMVQAWHQTLVDTNQCESWGCPLVKKEVFSGKVDSISGMDLILTTSAAGANFDTALDFTNEDYYIEVIAGDNIGHRFDVTAGGVNSLTLAADINVCAGPIYNTINTAANLPADLDEDAFILREHLRLSEMFPAAEPFKGGSSASTADRLLFYNGSGWNENYYDNNFVNGWSIDGVSDSGDAVVPPCQGLYIHPRQGAVTVMAIGVVRENEVVCPLAPGYNFLTNPYPLNLTPSEIGFTSSVVDGGGDPTLSDQILVWSGNTNAAQYLESYTAYFFLEGFAGQGFPDRWLLTQDNDVSNIQDTTQMFNRDRATFFYRKDPSCLEDFKMPLSWQP